MPSPPTATEAPVKMNAWEKEAEATGLIKERTWGFLNREDAIHAKAHAVNRMRYMDYEYQGCDWCCGGGVHEYGFYQSVVRLANKYLKNKEAP
jgi:hypothetical protein